MKLGKNSNKFCANDSTFRGLLCNNDGNETLILFKVASSYKFFVDKISLLKKNFGF